MYIALNRIREVSHAVACAVIDEALKVLHCAIKLFHFNLIL